MLEKLTDAAVVLSYLQVCESREELIGAFLARIAGLVLGIFVGLILARKRLNRFRRSSSSPGVTTAVRMRRDEKRRLAQVLVSEIRLRNARQVDDGRRCRDLGVRFDPDLQRTYKVFAGRVGDGYESARIFREVVVKILAGGDAGALGDLPWLGTTPASARE
jgi:hypothetical protein